MGRVIIDNRSSQSDMVAVSACQKVMRNGRISGAGDKKQYCYATRVFTQDSPNLMVYASKNKCSDRFTVTDDKQLLEE